MIVQSLQCLIRNKMGILLSVCINLFSVLFRTTMYIKSKARINIEESYLIET